MLTITVARKTAADIACMQGPGGVTKLRVLASGEITLSIDRPEHSNRMPCVHRRLDLSVWLKREKRAVMYEVVCTGDQSPEMEKTRKEKCQELAADLSK